MKHSGSFPKALDCTGREVSILARTKRMSGWDVDVLKCTTVLKDDKTFPTADNDSTRHQIGPRLFCVMFVYHIIGFWSPVVLP